MVVNVTVAICSLFAISVSITIKVKTIDAKPRGPNHAKVSLSLKFRLVNISESSTGTILKIVTLNNA